MFKRLSLFALATVAASAAPVISSGGVLNAASNAPLGANTGIAQGAYFSIYGSGLGPATAATATVPYPTTLPAASGASVTITPASGPPIQAFVQFVVASQINAILPSTTPLGAATVTVTYGGATSAAAKINVVKTGFGIFTTAYGSGPAAAQYLDSTGKLLGTNSLTQSALPGDYIVLYGTGLGPISTADNTAPGAVSPSGVSNSTVQISAGGATITPLYVGRQGSSPALDQIDFLLPSSIADSCFVPVAVIVNGLVSNYATFSKTSSGTTCPPPFGLSSTALKTLDAGGNVNLGILSLSHEVIPASSVSATLTGNVVIEAAGGTFTAYNATQLYTNLVGTPGSASPFNALGTCIVAATTSSASTSTIPTSPTQLNAGAQLTLSGPGGTVNVPFVANAGYAATLAESIPGLPALNGLPSSFLSAGTWTMKGPGGADVGPFSASITIPTQLACTNCSTITTINRTQPLTVNWTGGGGPNDFVLIGGTSSAPLTADPTKNVSYVFECSAAASAGTFTVPVSILSQMPVSSNVPTAANTGSLDLVSILGANTSFTAPLVKGGNLDTGFFGYSGIFFQFVGYN